jgi:hypothetical protein
MVASFLFMVAPFPFTVTIFLKKGGTILNCPACLLNLVVCFLVSVSSCELESAHLFVLGAGCPIE